MAMIQQYPARLRATLAHALSGRKVAYAGGAVTLLMVLLFGLNPMLLWITANYGFLLIPSALGVPLLLPGLRFTPLPDQSWTALGCEDFAALLLVGTVVRLLARHRRLYPSSGRLHRFFAGWGALMVGGLLAGLFRGLVVARMVEAGPLGYFGYPALGALSALLCTLLLGWIPGLAAVFAVVPAAAVDRAREWWAESGRLVLVYLVEPATELVHDWRDRLRKHLDDWRHDRRHDAANPRGTTPEPPA
ncbi:hypothetical protein ABIA33_001136 [Streptacidiphilus sp. MAP12-16]|uniref:hypothetical protein n=1 Tax=Streptacidiphilus sp. MAP12-16 TaxID=3156300 RepID=UPI0035149A57